MPPRRDMQGRGRVPGSSAARGTFPPLQLSVLPSRPSHEVVTAPLSPTNSPPVDSPTNPAPRPPLLSKAFRNAQSSGLLRPASVISKPVGPSFDSFIQSVSKLAKRSVTSRIGGKLRQHSTKGRSRSKSPPALQFFFLSNSAPSPAEPAPTSGPNNPVESAPLPEPLPLPLPRPTSLPSGDLRHRLRSIRAAAPPLHPADPSPPPDAPPAAELNQPPAAH